MKPVIFHVDVNSAFLSWTAAEALRRGDPLDLRTVPSAIAGDVENRHGIILAKSTPAKAFGIKTGEAIWQAREKCPELLLARPDYELYVRQSRRFIALLKEVAPVVEQYSIDEAWADMSGTGWSRGDPLEAAEALRLRVKKELGFTVNVGVSSNKLLAKMAGELRKPDKVNTLFPEEIQTKLWPLPVRELFTVGRATEQKLAFFGIHTIGELARSDPDFLRARLHKHGEQIWHYANGRGDCRVNGETEPNKGYGNSVTTARDVTDSLSAHRVLLSLCETVGARMRSDGQTGRVVMVHIRNGALEDSSHQRTLPCYTAATNEIWEGACRCFDELWDGHTPLRQLGVQVSRVVTGEPRQFNFLDNRGERWDRLDKAVDKVRGKYGEDALYRACFLRGENPAMGGGLSKHRRTGITKPIG